MRLSVFLWAVFLIHNSDASVGHRYYCPESFIRLGNGCYFFSAQISSWQNAHFTCRDMESQLLVLDSRWEDSTIRSYLSKPQFARLERWIGGLYDWSAQQWLWGATGKPITNFVGFGDLTPNRFREWHCIYMDPEQAHTWNHKLCTKDLHYICEAPLIKISENR